MRAVMGTSARTVAPKEARRQGKRCRGVKGAFIDKNKNVGGVKEEGESLK